jgi:hypothetical protein
LTVVRPRAWVGRCSPLKVFIDHLHVADLPAAAEQTFEVPAGRHLVGANTGWWDTTYPIEVQIQPNQSTRVNCSARRRGPAVLLAGWDWMRGQPLFDLQVI